MATLKIDPEFRSLIPPLRPEELEQLEENILADGCRDPLAVWKGHDIILDGHNRYDICITHDLDFDVVEIDLPDREAAIDWIIANQLGRRNLLPDQYSLMRGLRLERMKKQGERTDLTSRQNVGKSTTAEILADQYGVTSRTIERDGQFARAVETLKVVDPEIQTKVIQGKAPPKGIVVEAAKVIKAAEEEAELIEAAPLLDDDEQEPEVIREEARQEAKAILNGRRKPEDETLPESKEERFRKHFLKCFNQCLEHIDGLTRAVAAQEKHGGYGGFPTVLALISRHEQLKLRGEVETMVIRLQRWHEQIEEHLDEQGRQQA